MDWAADNLLQFVLFAVVAAGLLLAARRRGAPAVRAPRPIPPGRPHLTLVPPAAPEARETPNAGASGSAGAEVLPFRRRPRGAGEGP